MRVDDNEPNLRVNGKVQLVGVWIIILNIFVGLLLAGIAVFVLANAKELWLLLLGGYVLVIGIGSISLGLIVHRNHRKLSTAGSYPKSIDSVTPDDLRWLSDYFFSVLVAHQAKLVRVETSAGTAVVAVYKDSV